MILILTVIVGSVAAWISWQQMQIARVKLHYDLYDRRFKVYDAARGLLAHTSAEGKPSIEVLNEYWRSVADAVFLFDKSVETTGRSGSRRCISLASSPRAALDIGSGKPSVLLITCRALGGLLTATDIGEGSSNRRS